MERPYPRGPAASPRGTGIATWRQVARVVLLGLALAGATELSARASTRSPLPVHALVVPEPRDARDGELLAERVSWLLRNAGYVLLDSAVLEGRTGEAPRILHQRCAGDAACWREAGELAGVDQIVLVDMVGESTFGVRVVDVGGSGGFRQESASMTGGWPDPDLVEGFFQGLGALRVDGLPSAATVQIDGGDPLPSPHGLVIDPVTAGKHGLDFEAEGYAPLFVTLMVYPGQETTLTVQMAVERVEPKAGIPRSSWVGVALAVGGVVALGVAGGARSRAWER